MVCSCAIHHPGPTDGHALALRCPRAAPCRWMPSTRGPYGCLRPRRDRARSSGRSTPRTSAEAPSLGLRILAAPPNGVSPVCSKPGSQTKAQAPVRHGDIPLRRSAVDPDIPKTPLAQLRQQLPVATAPIPDNDGFRQPAEHKTENGAKTAGARWARSFRVPMRCRTSRAFSAGQTTRRPNRRARPLWRCPARVQVFHPQDDVLRALGYIPIHALIPFAGIIVWHRNHPPAVGDLRAKPLSVKGLEIYTH